MIGIDVSYLCARPRAAFAEYTPSTTILTSFMASSIVYPFPIRMPARRFLECMLAQVTIRSPIPLSPKNVSRRPPIAVPRRAISVIPRVINAALVLSPYPKPSATPAASATTFLSAAPSSIPSTSGLVYTRNTGLIKIPWIFSAISFFLEPTTIVVGIPLPTSSAWDGPESTATSACGTSSSMI